MPLLIVGTFNVMRSFFNHNYQLVSFILHLGILGFAEFVDYGVKLKEIER